MAFYFKDPLNVSSLQKRFQEKESRRVQKHMRKAQEDPKLPQESLGLSGSPQSQICDIPVADQVYEQDAIPRLDGEPPSINTTPGMAGASDFLTPTKPIGVDGRGNVTYPESLAWDVGTLNDCFDADPWPYPFPNQHGVADVHDASPANVQRANPTRDDQPGRSGPEDPALARSHPTFQETAIGLVALIAPTQHHGVSVKDITQVDASSLGRGDAGVAVPSPTHAPDLPSTLSTEEALSCISPSAQPEESTLAIEEAKNPSPSSKSSIQALVKAHRPQDPTQYTSVADYPTPPSNCYQTSKQPAKHGLSERKRTYPTANDTQAVEDVGDNDAILLYDRSRPKRQRNDTATSLLEKESSSERSPTLAPFVSRSSGNSESSMSKALWNHACTSCGVDRTHLMRLSQNILRWADLPDSETLLTGNAPLTTLERGAILLRLAVGDLRDYLLEPLFEEEMELLAHESQSFHSNPARGRTPRTPALSTDVAAHHSDAENDGIATKNTTYSMEGGKYKLRKDRIENARTKVRKPRGRPPRWTADDEDRVREYLMKGMDWSDIATELNRSETGVQNYARIMEQRERPWTGIEDRRLRAYVIEGMKWSEIAAKLKRPNCSVALHWALSKA